MHFHLYPNSYVPATRSRGFASRTSSPTVLDPSSPAFSLAPLLDLLFLLLRPQPRVWKPERIRDN
jgi:hypothetical protein